MYVFINFFFKKGCNLQEDLVFFYYPPSNVVAALVSADKSGETVCRLVANLAILAA